LVDGAYHHLVISVFDTAGKGGGEYEEHRSDNRKFHGAQDVIIGPERNPELRWKILAFFLHFRCCKGPAGYIPPLLFPRRDPALPAGSPFR
jgi:hypothetical protein